MSVRKPFLKLFSCIALVQLAAHAGHATGRDAVDQRMTPNERGRAISLFVKRWAGYATTVYDVDVGTWSQGFVPQFAKLESATIRRALARTTYEGALAELDNRGDILSDDMVIDRLARLPKNAGAATISNAFNEIIGGLQYTPVQPCRILDTRTATEGPLAEGESRQVFVSGVPDYLYFGGADNNCGLTEAGLKAAVLNVTVVNPQGPGFATVYNPRFSAPNASSLNYVTGAITNNTVVAAVAPGEVGTPGYVMLRSTRAAHYVVDIVGYYETPRARNLQCTEAQMTTWVNPGVSEQLSVACPAGYSVTGGGARWASGYGSFIQLLDAGNIYSWPMTSDHLDSANHRFVSVGFNNGDTPAVLDARAMCCRVPGR